MVVVVVVVLVVLVVVGGLVVVVVEEVVEVEIDGDAGVGDEEEEVVTVVETVEGVVCVELSWALTFETIITTTSKTPIVRWRTGF